ncbi:hypothetical protein OY18_06995 [Xylella fastidiosa]|nr:hypothetical protein OY18_06995 [Xylella fastidiosa]
MVVDVGMANAVGGEGLECLRGGAGEGAAVELAMAADGDVIATGAGKQAALVADAGVVLGGVLAVAAEGGGTASAVDDQGAAEAGLALLGAGLQGVLQAGDVQVASNSGLNGVGVEVGTLQGGIAANADVGVVGHSKDGINLGDGLLAGGAAAASHISADAGAAAGH